MDMLKAMQVFVEVAKQEGFAPAAKQLELSTSSVSRHIVNLEAKLNRQLFNRTTRHITLTEAGSELLTRCRPLVEETTSIVDSLRNQTAVPSGRLKITMPTFLASLLAKDVIAHYANRYPDVSLEVVELTRVVNLVEEDFDLAIRVGDLPDSSLIARKLVNMKLVLVASPAYLKTHGEPTTINDLREHNCIVESDSPYKDRWPLMLDNIKQAIPVKPRIKVNNGDRARDLAAGGLGLALVPIYMVLKELQNKELVRVLDKYVPYYGGITAVYPNTRYQSNTVRTFIDSVRTFFDSVDLSH